MALPKVLQKIINNVGYGQALTGSDNDIVHKGGYETITGIKRFYSTNDGHTDYIYIQNDSVDISSSSRPEIATHNMLVFRDQNQKWGSTFQHNMDVDGTVSTFMTARKWINDQYVVSMLSAAVDSSGNLYAQAPSTLTTRVYDRDILTRDWIPKDVRIVHTTGDETIQGVKEFKNAYDDTIDSSNPNSSHSIVLRTTKFRKGTLPSQLSSNDYIGLIFQDNNGSLINHDGRLGCVAYNSVKLENGGYNCIQIACYKNQLESHDKVQFELGYDTNGIAYCYAPSTPLPDDRNVGTDVLTRDWIPKDTRIVHTTGNETITGNKLFYSTSTSNADYIYTKNSNVDISSSEPTASTHNILIFRDKNDKWASTFQTTFTTSGGRVGTCLSARKWINNAYKSGQFLLSMDSTGNDGYASFNSNIKTVRPEAAGTKLGANNNAYKWSEIWCAQSSINSSSDERMKSNVKAIPDDVLDAWENVNWIEFQYNDAIDAKGNDKARIHTGLIAQHVASAFEQANLPVDKYGFYLYDRWNAEDAVLDESGNVVSPAISAGDAYGLRYTEALCMEAAYNRRRVSRLEEKIKLLEQKLNLAS